MTEIIKAIDELIKLSESTGEWRTSIGVEKVYNARNDLIKLIKDYKIKECNCDK